MALWQCSRDAEVSKTPDADYRFRTFLPRSTVSTRIADAVAQIDTLILKDQLWIRGGTMCT
jgi:hypothetical protein